MQLPGLRRKADHVDVGVLAVHEVEVGAVAPHGQAAGQAYLGALLAGGVDQRHGLGHEQVGAPDRCRVLARYRLEHVARGLLLGEAQVLERVQHGLEDRSCQVDARPALLGVLLEDLPALQLAHDAARRRVGDAERALRLRHGDAGRAKGLVGERQGRAAQVVVEAAVDRGQGACLAHAPLGGLPHARQEEQQPRLPLGVGAHALQAPVVLVAMGLEVGREVEQGPRQAAAVDEKEGDEQPPEAAIAPHEGMDGLELSVQQAHCSRSGSVSRSRRNSFQSARVSCISATGGAT